MKTSTVFTTWPIPDPFANNGFLTVPKTQPITKGDISPVLITEGDSKGNQQVMSPRYERRSTFKSIEKNDPDSKNINLLKGSSQIQENSPESTTLPSLGAKQSTQAKSAFSIFNLQFPFTFKKPKNHFLFQTESYQAPITNDMVNALLQWQKLIKENKQLSKEDKQAAQAKVSYWPENIHRANWSNEFIDNETELDEPAENAFKKQAFLWEFTPPYHGGFVWPGTNWKN